MHVTGRDRQRDRRLAFAGHLDAAGVGAAAGEDLQLVEEGLLLRQGPELLHQAGVGDGGGVHDLDGHALAELRDVVLLVHARDVAGQGHVDGHADVGVDAVGGHGGAADADLLLAGHDRVDVVLRGLGPLQRADDHPHGDAVVHGLAGGDVAPLHEGLVEGHRGADFDLLGHFLRRQAEVHEQVVEGGQLLLLLVVHDVDRLGADQADQLLRLAHDHHALGDEGLRVEAAGGIQAEEAVVVDEADQEADLVHVTGQHDLLLALFERPALDGDEVPHRVHLDLVHDGLEFTAADVPDLSLETGRGDRFGQFLQEFHVLSSSMGGALNGNKSVSHPSGATDQDSGQTCRPPEARVRASDRAATPRGWYRLPYEHDKSDHRGRPGRSGPRPSPRERPQHRDDGRNVRGAL